TWGADTSPESWIEIQLRARLYDHWSKFYRVAVWDAALTASRRTSLSSQGDLDGRLATDTLLLAAPADAIQVRVLLCAAPGADMPDLDYLTLCGSDRRQLVDALSLASVQQHMLRLPILLSQFLSFSGGEGWCSPTSLAMCLAYWRQFTGDRRLSAFCDAACVPNLVVPMVYDPAWQGTGNWAFNTAYAASLGLTAYVTRMHSLAQVARWTAAGVPVICSLSWQLAEIDEAPGTTSGHLDVVVGFDGDYILVAEPASRNMVHIIRRYRADQFYACWQRSSNGTVYLLYPAGYACPAPSPGDAWV
ncbi:MAG: peptidase C39 family protein, partial [Oscillochloris sp.]|nr:peptidase C39 family protein [Oscillochloris sp.]